MSYDSRIQILGNYSMFKWRNVQNFLNCITVYNKEIFILLVIMNSIVTFILCNMNEASNMLIWENIQIILLNTKVQIQ